jgi:tetratricopeptide (TPR) repeat protein
MNILESNISLLEDHHEALSVWREKGFKNLDLVHIDAHVDFGFHPARPKELVIKEAKTLAQLKQELERSLLYQRYEKNFDRQTNIGNYIYPAMSENIIKDLYWVIPGRLKEFKASLKSIKEMLRGFSRQDPYQSRRASYAAGCTLKDGIISTKLLGRKFVICILEKLPILEQKVLLDMDTDFLVIDSLLSANNTDKIGKRRRWIRPDRLVKDLLISKKLKPVFTTIAYSVNGGFTPMRYKVLGDELAYRLSPKHFKEQYAEKFIASAFFERFVSTGKKKYYLKAIKLDSSYQAADNNYGPLYLSTRKFSRAKREFLRIANADPKNPYPFLGLGNIALEKKDFPKARNYFSYALKQKKDLPQAYSGLAQAEFGLKNFKKAKRLFLYHQNLEPMQPQSYYLLGRIYEEEKDFEKSAAYYQDALMLGLNDIDALLRLLKVSCYVKTNFDIIKYVSAKYKEFKKGFAIAKRLSLKSGKKIKGLREAEEKMAALEKSLQK